MLFALPLKPQAATPNPGGSFAARRFAVHRMLALGLVLVAIAAHADERVEICYNYGCDRHAQVVFTEADFEVLQGWLGVPASAAEERLRIGRAIAILYVAAARTTPI